MSTTKNPIGWRWLTALGWKIRTEQPPVEWNPEPIFSAETVSNIEKERDKLQAELTNARNAILRKGMQRDELLAALEALNSASSHGFLYDDPARVKARSVIARVKGGAA